MENRKIIIISGPSAVGKTRVINCIKKMSVEFEHLISYTTREKRQGEENGKDYHFVSRSKFDNMAGNNLFYEVSKNELGYYGITKESMEKILQNNKNIILDSDLSGYQQFKKKWGRKCVGIFLKPTSLDELYQQLKDRGENRGIKTDLDFRIRWEKNMEVMNQSDAFDFAIVNDSVELTAKKIIEIVNNFHYD